jgi:hypothetical protein
MIKEPFFKIFTKISFVTSVFEIWFKEKLIVVFKDEQNSLFTCHIWNMRLLATYGI